ncbi:sensor histidine kinase YehU [mine drainage metagenome]|uniref:Sensor histidine kinase YehU n=1 Tax=mine drainage metagenome TaxID=410659 RepID=A0A1J5SI13_9ZZZZ
MKKLLLYGNILLCCVLTTKAQNNNGHVITFIAEVPLVIETGIYIDTLANGKNLTTISGKIKIALANRNRAIESDQYFKIAKPVDIRDLQKIEYCYFINNQTKKHWLSLPLQKTDASQFPYDGIIVDTSIRINEKITLQFRWKKNHTIIQQNVFSRPELLPTIFSYRQKNQFDSLDSRIKSKAVEDSKNILKGFDTLTKNRLIVLPGKQLEFLFKKISIHTDSCILFRLREIENKENTAWHLTGHLLTLNTIHSNSSYTLEVKYMGMDAFNNYRIDVLPFWYQTSWARLLFIISFALSITGLPYIFYRYKLRKEKQKRIQIQKQLKTVQSQLNPHFVYNALSSIEALVSGKENDRANEYLSAFSDIMRDTLRNSELLLISLSEDIEMLEKYISIEQLRFEFNYIMEIDTELDIDTIEFPPMLLQPTVENAVKHGVSGLGREGLIRILFLKNEKNLTVIIQDNGKEKNGNIKDGHGYGILFTKERIKHLKKLYQKEKIEYRIVYNENSTIVRFIFENWL